MKRNYKLQDVYDYLLEYYNLDWRFCKILEDEAERGVRKIDFGGADGAKLRVLAIVYNNEKSEKAWIEVDNQNLSVLKVSPSLKEVKPPQTTWQNFLAHRHIEEQNLNN